MKALILFLLWTITSPHSYAQTSLSTIIQPTAAKVQSLCPVNMLCVVDGTEITLTYNLNCQATLTGFQYKVEESERNLVVYLNATTSDAPQTSDCSQEINESISLPNKFGEVIIYTLNKEDFLNLDF